MKKLFLFLFIISSLSAFSQNWSIINSNERYHYKTRESDFYTNTIQVDSIFYDGTDSVFYLNTICKPCDTCAILGTYIAYQEQCFNKIVRKMSNGNYVFYLPDTFYINANDAIGDTWIYRINASDTIFASISNIDSASVLGIPDSVKSILLSNNDTLLLSKNYGMLQMLELSDTQTFQLIGLQTQHIGFTLPTWREIYDFNVGDSFYYYSAYAISGEPDNPESYHRHDKIYILSKVETDSSINYDVWYITETVRPSWSWPFNDYVIGGSGNAFLVYQNKEPNDYDENTYNHKLGGDPRRYNRFIQEIKPNNGRIEVTYLDDKSYGISFGGDSTILFPGPLHSEFNYYISGMGNIDKGYYGALSSTRFNALICYNGIDTFNYEGGNCSNFYNITSILPSVINNINIAYNQYQINLDNLAANSISYLLFDNQGRTILSGDSREENIQIDISTLSHGMYYLKTSVADASSTYKILK